MSRTIPLPDRFRLLTAAFAMSLVVVAGALPLAGQGAEPDVERARALEARAEGHLEQMTRLDRAATLFRRAAELRPDADPSKVENLRMAARLSFHLGQESRAMEDAAAAGRLAMRQGDVIAASHAYLDAAWIANELGDADRAGSYIAEARLLATSPLLAEAERDAIRARIVG